MTTSRQRLPAALTPLDTALNGLLHGLDPVAPRELPLAEALHGIAADGAVPMARPAHDIAVLDGWALRAADLVGASSYTPLPLPVAPAWVEAGDQVPAGCDCVLDDDSVDRTTPIVQVLTEATPGQGLRRAGGDIAAGGLIVAAGERVSPRHLLLARAGGIETMAIRRPRLAIVNIPGGAMTASLIAESARAEAAEAVSREAAGRDAGSIAEAFDGASCDLLITIGGSGVGRTDAAVTALRRHGEVGAHGIALAPGRSAAVGRIGATPVVALPGAPGQALAAWWTLALPVLDRLAARLPRPAVGRPLKRKIASSVGVAEVVLLAQDDAAWALLAAGDLPLQAIARADAWLVVAAESEGHAAGALVNAYMLRQ